MGAVRSEMGGSAPGCRVRVVQEQVGESQWPEGKCLDADTCSPGFSARSGCARAV